MVKLADRVKVLTPTVGTVTLSLGDAVTGYQTLSEGGIQDGDTVRYVIEDGTNWELGTGTFSTAGPTLTRTVLESSNTNNLLSLTGNASVFLTVGRTDLQRAVDMDQGVATTDSPTFVGLTTGSLTIGGTPVTATGAELNILDGVTATPSEINTLAGITSTTAELNILDGVTASTAELNILDGVTASTAELNILDGVTATTAELNILDGVTATTSEINLLTGVTSLGISAPGTTTDGGVALFDGADGSALKDGGTQDAVINGLTVGQGNAADGRSTAIGYLALANATGIRNTVFGDRAGHNITTGAYNVAIGRGALTGGLVSDSTDLITGPANITGSSNVAVGLGALAQVGSGSNNVAVGGAAGVLIVGGGQNTLVGDSTTTGISSSGSNNIALGYQAGSSSSPNNIAGNSNRVVIGNNNVTNAYIKVSWTVTSDERDKTDFAAMSHGLDVVDAIDTFTFKFDNRSSYYVYDDDGNIIDQPAPDGTHKSERTFVGFKAQQVQAVLDAAGFPPDVVVDTEDPENLKMKETALIPLLINAIKELKARVEALENP